MARKCLATLTEQVVMAFPRIIAKGVIAKNYRAGGFLVFLALLLFLFNAPVCGAQERQPDAEGGVYRFDAGDVLEVFVYEEPELTQTVTVRSDGRISLPLIGDVKAAGMNSEALADDITRKLSKFLDAPSVTVMLAESRGKVYYILGQVESPGEYSITRPVTVIQAIARAGGFLEWAKKSRLMIVRDGDESGTVTYFDYDRFLDKPGKEANVAIHAGDTIIVP